MNMYSMQGMEDPARVRANQAALRKTLTKGHEDPKREQAISREARQQEENKNYAFNIINSIRTMKEQYDKNKKEKPYEKVVLVLNEQSIDKKINELLDSQYIQDKIKYTNIDPFVQDSFIDYLSYQWNNSPTKGFKKEIIDDFSIYKQSFESQQNYSKWRDTRITNLRNTIDQSVLTDSSKQQILSELEGLINTQTSITEINRAIKERLFTEQIEKLKSDERFSKGVSKDGKGKSTSQAQEDPSNHQNHRNPKANVTTSNKLPLKDKSFLNLLNPKEIFTENQLSPGMFAHLHRVAIVMIHNILMFINDPTISDIPNQTNIPRKSSQKIYIAIFRNRIVENGNSKPETLDASFSKDALTGKNVNANIYLVPEWPTTSHASYMSNDYTYYNSSITLQDDNYTNTFGELVKLALILPQKKQQSMKKGSGSWYDVTKIANLYSLHNPATKDDLVKLLQIYTDFALELQKKMIESNIDLQAYKYME